ncbi:putative leucine-rich repeat receptor-like serine/threonine-protein kinase At2g19230 isoform X2 [Camellia sinensis]|uniref:putative leucine-rich repeat receptor-like serine/threonine-protein kinase At2g19230 isoform X2 n=1 Tax=Camellia sinensis TaxID=4442 RepID=UPI0010369EEC|nr:putative leucine-rich repeat receptor-like serine/threonine-protein kinase At2g19230 isoform X2 [Camellia sinensis]
MSVSLSLCDSLSLRFSLSLTSALLPFSLSHLPSFDSLSLSLSLLSPSLLVQEHHRRRHPLHMRTIANQQPISSYLVVTIHHWGTSQKCGESIVGSFNSDKAIVFPYNEVCDSTLNLSMSLKIGQGSYGSVYLGKLRGDDVAIKQMNDTKSKEFMSELNILCRVHHTNLIKLIGYATGGDSLFLVYELAQNGALSDHLHNPAIRAPLHQMQQYYRRLCVPNNCSRKWNALVHCLTLEAKRTSVMEMDYLVHKAKLYMTDWHYKHFWKEYIFFDRCVWKRFGWTSSYIFGKTNSYIFWMNVYGKYLDRLLVCIFFDRCAMDNNLKHNDN